MSWPASISRLRPLTIHTGRCDLALITRSVQELPPCVYLSSMFLSLYSTPTNHRAPCRSLAKRPYLCSSASQVRAWFPPQRAPFRTPSILVHSRRDRANPLQAHPPRYSTEEQEFLERVGHHDTYIRPYREEIYSYTRVVTTLLKSKNVFIPQVLGPEDEKTAYSKADHVSTWLPHARLQWGLVLALTTEPCI